MKIQLGNNSKIQIIPVFKNMDYDSDLLKFALDNELFDSDLGSVYTDIGMNSTKTVLLGLGNLEDISYDKLRLAGYKLANVLNKSKVKDFNIKLPLHESLCYFKTVLALSEGLYQSEYHFDKFLSKKEERNIENVYICVPDDRISDANEGIKEAEDIINGIFLARDLINEPAMYLYPETLANIAKDKLTPLGVDVTIMDEEEIKKIGMTAFLSVAQGSDRPPKFFIMNYNGNPSSDEKFALVGKGLTYDSGGYCIKPPSGMIDMHTDMGGAGTVIGAIHAIASAKLKINVVGVVASCENMISGKAYKTGDIIGSLSGKTIEVANTDAEGRLTLADALYYTADVIKPTAIIDLATLTGACVVALGEIYAGIVTNNDDLMASLTKASKFAGEHVWQLPVCDEYRDLIKSKLADLKNVGVRGAGTITAGLFLENFVKDTPWVHMDIAGTAYATAQVGYLPTYATGAHVKTLFYLMKNKANKNK